MVHEHPKPLPPGSTLQRFVPDSSLSWVVVYATACEDPQCEENHRRLFIIPVIGWAQFFIGEDEDNYDTVLRPMVMLGDGTSTDYLETPRYFKFIAVLKAGLDVPMIAREIYAEVYGEDEANKITEVRQEGGQLSN